MNTRACRRVLLHSWWHILAHSGFVAGGDITTPVIQTHPSQPVTRFNIFQVSPEPQGEVPITSGFQTLGILLQVPQQPLLEAEHSLLAVTHLSTHASVLFQRAVALNL